MACQPNTLVHYVRGVVAVHHPKSLLFCCGVFAYEFLFGVPARFAAVRLLFAAMVFCWLRFALLCLLPVFADAGEVQGINALFALYT